MGAFGIRLFCRLLQWRAHGFDFTDARPHFDGEVDGKIPDIIRREITEHGLTPMMMVLCSMAWVHPQRHVEVDPNVVALTGVSGIQASLIIHVDTEGAGVISDSRADGEAACTVASNLGATLTVIGELVHVGSRGTDFPFAEVPAPDEVGDIGAAGAVACVAVLVIEQKTVRNTQVQAIRIVVTYCQDRLPGGIADRHAGTEIG